MKYPENLAVHIIATTEAINPTIPKNWPQPVVLVAFIGTVMWLGYMIGRMP